MKNLTTMECEQVSGGLILAILGCIALAGAIAGAVYAGYELEQHVHNEKCK